MESRARTRVLCVDDEPNVLEGVSLHLHRRYEVVTATSGPAGLAALEKDPSIAVVMSDMRMPGMDGAQFLSQVRAKWPDVVRLLLTGQADMKSAIAAVNEGQIFRFLTKPCPPQQLLGAFEAAVEQYRLLTTERVLLEQTLNGSIKMLVDVLGLTSPAAFGRASRLKSRVSAVAAELGVSPKWQVEVAALLSQLATITLPPEVLEKMTFGGELGEAEQKMVERLPEVTEQLLAHIPRLDPVRAILARVAKRAMPGELPSEPGEKRTLELSTRLLRVALDFDELEAQGSAPARAIDTLRGRGDRYDARVLDTFADLFGRGAAQEIVRELPLAALKAGMVFLEDVRLTTGALLCARGYEVTTSFLARAQNFRSGSVKEPIRVRVPPEPDGTPPPSKAGP
ncbi:MAG TPA: HD domain-containing phosphohydrolase [Polyangiaceae bacterium]|jgi:response regulator RpfG family c-di-GMP phosphodiesterase|nr:HD domain-containing phosphohydrolase [Polyangiaceae bacterium]